MLASQLNEAKGAIELAQNVMKESDTIDKLHQQLKQLKAAKAKVDQEAENLRQESARVMAESDRDKQEMKDEYKKKMKQFEDSSKRHRQESDKANDDEVRTRHRLYELERRVVEKEDALKGANTMVQRLQRSQDDRDKETRKLNDRIQQLERKLQEASSEPQMSMQDMLTRSQEDDRLRAQNSALQNESNMLSKKTQGQRKYLQQMQEHLAVLASKERDLMAAIDALRVQHGHMSLQVKQPHTPNSNPSYNQKPTKHAGNYNGRHLSGAGGLIIGNTYDSNSRVSTPTSMRPRSDVGILPPINSPQPYAHFLPTKSGE